MPLRCNPVGQDIIHSQEGRVSSHPLFEKRHAVGHRFNDGNPEIGTLEAGTFVGIFHFKAIGRAELREMILERDNHREILDDSIRMRTHRINIDTAGLHGENIIRIQRSLNYDAFHVIDEIPGGFNSPYDILLALLLFATFFIQNIGFVKIAIDREIVPHINQLFSRIGNNQVQVIDELNGRRGIAGRIGPDQRNLHISLFHTRRHLNRLLPSLSCGKSITHALFLEPERPSAVVHVISQCSRYQIGHVGNTPTLIIDSVRLSAAILSARRIGAVDE